VTAVRMTSMSWTFLKCFKTQRIFFTN